MGLLSFINKDVVSNNERKQGMVSIRCLYLIIAVAYTVDLLVAGIPVILSFKWKILALFAALTLLFALTFRTKTRTSLIVFTLFLLMWILTMIPALGWSAGLQNYYIVILIVCFFAAHGKLAFKFFLSGLILAVRIASIFLFSGVEPKFPIAELNGKIIQAVNISAVFLAVVLVSYIFSHRENIAESELMKYNNRLIKEANTDPLTGLSNRRCAFEYLGFVCRSPGMNAMSVAMGDIDFFKKVNDTYGHDAGDEVLKYVSKTMREICGKDVFAARWGGEEFLLVFPGGNGDETLQKLESLRRAIDHSSITVDEQKIHVTMTFGLTEYDFNGNPECTIQEADRKLYQGKENGRNQVVF